jgi:hypothetical protein
MLPLPSIIFRVVIPGHLLIPQYLRHRLEASQMNALTICDDDFVLGDARIANVVRLVGNILEREREERLWPDKVSNLFALIATPSSGGRQRKLSREVANERKWKIQFYLQ